MATEAGGGGARTNVSSRVSPAPSRDSRYRFLYYPGRLFKVALLLGRFLLYRKVKDELERIPARESVSTESGRSQVARRAARIATVIRGARLLLVNDIPAEMAHVIEILRDLGLVVQVETSSEGALRALSSDTYHVVISDMERDAVEDEGIRFLKQMRERGILFPLILWNNQQS